MRARQKVLGIAWDARRDQRIRYVDPKAKEAKLGEPVAGVEKACGGAANAFDNFGSDLISDFACSERASHVRTIVPSFSSMKTRGDSFG